MVSEASALQLQPEIRNPFIEKPPLITHLFERIRTERQRKASDLTKAFQNAVHSANIHLPEHEKILAELTLQLEQLAQTVRQKMNLEHQKSVSDVTEQISIDELVKDNSYVAKSINEIKTSHDSRLMILLTLKGIKPVCEVYGSVDVSNLSLHSEIVYKDGKPITLISKSQDNIDKLKALIQAVVPGAPSKEGIISVGRLFGYPETAIQSYAHITKEEMMAGIQQPEIPKHLREIANFHLSKEHWREELATVETWYQQVKDILPKIH